MLPRHDADMVKRALGQGGKGPLLVYGPRSPSYDFGPTHPLTPRRFGPGIELLRSIGAEPGLAPEPASDEDLLLCHTAAYVAAVRRLAADPWGPGEAGIGPGGDNPSFAGMHDAGAMVAGGSMRAMEAVLRGDVEHAFHPGGGLHHAMPSRASGFCIYDDPALAIALARRAGLRVLYIDLDVHHGDGVEAIHWDDPGVMTISFHESGRYLFPGSGFANELGEGTAAGTAINIPFEPFAGDEAWLPWVRSIPVTAAAAFGPDIVVSQHGCDSHAWDPLAHLRVTTTAMGAAARLVDRVAHRWAAGRWLATGGGGYDAYRVVPRAWAHVWLAGAHRPPPPETPKEWRDRWAEEAARYGQSPLPMTFDDRPNAGERIDDRSHGADNQSSMRAATISTVVTPAFLLEARSRGWWDPFALPPAQVVVADGQGQPTILDPLSADALERLGLAARTIPPADPAEGRAILAAAMNGAQPRPVVVVAVDDAVIVGVAVAAPRTHGHPPAVVALGVAPAYRRRGLATRLLATLVDRVVGGALDAMVTVAERDPIDPLDHGLRMSIARRLLETAGFSVRRADGAIGRIDPAAIVASRRSNG
jgi:acetoin utilization protein AcuC